MIDPNNPLQVTWLKTVNAEIGNLVTSNAALDAQNLALADKVFALQESCSALQKQNEDMGLTNAKLREDLDLYRKRKPKDDKNVL